MVNFFNNLFEMKRAFFRRPLHSVEPNCEQHTIWTHEFMWSLVKNTRFWSLTTFLQGEEDEKRNW
jgi:hypothetical protein